LKGIAGFREEYLQLLKLVKTKSLKPDVKLVKKAFDYSLKAHSSQKRASGEPYFVHPLKVAITLADWGMDSASVCAGLLHDCLEDTSVNEAQLKREFGSEVLELVNGVTKVKKIASSSRREKRIKSLEKLLLASTKDLRVLIVKIADKIHNLQTLEFLSVADRNRIAKDALEVYAPLAHKLSMHNARFEIENLAFKCLEPEKCAEIEAKIALKRKVIEKSMDFLSERLRADCDSAGIPVVFEKESKGAFTAFKKMSDSSKGFDEVFDYSILDVLTNNVDDCYRILGKLHALYKPIPRKFKDWIAIPEHNLYQALHTTVIGPEGIPIKCYINTFEMHEIGDLGITYFFRHKDCKSARRLEEKTKWLKSLMPKEALKDSEKFEKSLADNLLPYIYVLTPDGKKVELPEGSNSIDFAFNVHTSLGLHCWKSFVNGREEKIQSPLLAGDVVRIIESEKVEARPNWLSGVKSRKAVEALKRRFKSK